MPAPAPPPVSAQSLSRLKSALSDADARVAVVSDRVERARSEYRSALDALRALGAVGGSPKEIVASARALASEAEAEAARCAAEASAALASIEGAVDA